MFTDAAVAKIEADELEGRGFKKFELTM